jgi:hypothetical protein
MNNSLPWTSRIFYYSCRLDETASLNCGHQRAYCSSPRWHEYGEPRQNVIDRVRPKNSEKNLSQCRLIHHKSHMDWPGPEPRPPRWEAAANHLRHGTTESYFTDIFILSSGRQFCLQSSSLVIPTEEWEELNSGCDIGGGGGSILSEQHLGFAFKNSVSLCIVFLKTLAVPPTALFLPSPTSSSSSHVSQHATRR